jgi:hypothetical protein
MELSISEAGKLLGVHRSTLHEWLTKGWIKKNKKTGLVEIAEIVERLRNMGRIKGRAAGYAYKDAQLSNTGDIAVTLERGVVILAEIFKTLSSEQQTWIRRSIFDRIGDPRLLEQKEEPVDTSQMVLAETQQEQTWNNLLVRGTLKPKVHTSSPAIRAWGKKFKKRVLLEAADLAVPEELLNELSSIIEPSKADPALTLS